MNYKKNTFKKLPRSETTEKNRESNNRETLKGETEWMC